MYLYYLQQLIEDCKTRRVPVVSPDETPFPKPILPPRTHAGPDYLGMLNSDPKAYLEIDPIEMARQLTLIEFEIFVRIKPYECLDQIWDNHRRKEPGLQVKTANPRRNQPGSLNSDISKLIDHTNQVTDIPLDVLKVVK